MRKTKLGRKKVGVVILWGIALILILLTVKYRTYQKKLQKHVEQLDQLSVEATVIMDDMDTEEKEHSTYDFNKLRETNSDIYAWIEIPGTKVDYPVLQSETDNKYLNTNIDGSEGYPGCIYSNKCNSRNFDDYITVLYGHNMKSGEMFGSLHQFEEQDFFDSFDTYTVETEKARYTYEVYAAVDYNDCLITAEYGAKTVEGRDQFIESLGAYKEDSKTHFKEKVTISGEDKVLVLSVCISGQADRRILVVSRLKESVEF